MYSSCHTVTNLHLFSVEMDSMRKQSELDKKSYDDLVRERDILSKVSQIGPIHNRRPPPYACICRDYVKLKALQRRCNTLLRLESSPYRPSNKKLL